MRFLRVEGIAGKNEPFCAASAYVRPLVREKCVGIFAMFFSLALFFSSSFSLFIVIHSAMTREPDFNSSFVHS